MKTLKRLGAGILALGLVGTGSVLVAPAASAHANSVTGAATCADDGTYTVTWTVTNDFGTRETVNHVGHTPDAATVSPLSVEIARFGSGTMTSTGIPGTATEATLTVAGTWTDGFTERPKTGRVRLDGTCAAPPSGHTPVNVCHATSSDKNPYVFITVDDDSVKFKGHLMHRNSPNKTWKSDGVFRGKPVKAGDPKPDLIGDYTDKAGNAHVYDGVITSKTDCGVLTPPVVTKPNGSFGQKCTDTGAEVTIGDLDSGTFGDVVWTLTYGTQSKTVVEGEKVAVPGEVGLDLSYTAGGTSKSVQSGMSLTACPPPVVTEPDGSFGQKCTDTGAEVTIGALDSGTFESVVWTLTYGGQSKTVVEGEQVVVPGEVELDLSYSTGSTSKSVQSGMSLTACPPPVVTAPSGSFTTECTATGARADVGTLSPGTATGGTFRLVAPGFSQPVTTGQQDVTVPVSETIMLEFVPAVGSATVLDTESSPAACPPSTVAPVAPVRGLGVVKAVSPTGAVEFGATLTYALTVTATGTAPQTAVTVTDSVPSGTTYEDGTASCDGTCTTGFSGGVVSWELGGMAAGSTRSVSFQVTVDTPTADSGGGFPAVTIRNTGAVRSAEVPSTLSNEVETPVTPVTAVLGTKTGGDDTTTDDTTTDDTTEEEVAAATTGTGVLAATGAGLPTGGLVSIAMLLILAGLALVSVGRPAARRTTG